MTFEPASLLRGPKHDSESLGLVILLYILETNLSVGWSWAWNISGKEELIQKAKDQSESGSEGGWFPRWSDKVVPNFCEAADGS